MKSQLHAVREEISSIEREVLSIKSTIGAADLANRESVPLDAPPADRGEMLANVTIAYRHLEDARMRLGKVIQAYDGGISCYSPPKPVADPAEKTVSGTAAG